MHPTAIKVAKIETGVKKLTGVIQGLRLQLTELKSENDLLRKQTIIDNETISESDKNIINYTTDNKENNIKAKQIINEMMREIDKCLLVLD